MAFKKLFLLIVFSIFQVNGHATDVQRSVLNAFTFGSYQTIMAKHAQQPFMVVIWSMTCPSCVKDMALLSNLHKSWPDLKMVMLATDDVSESEQIQAILAKNQLTELENWVFAEDNTQKLNYEIDPAWYGELPRTYFFDAAHVRQGVSGVLSQKDYEAQFAKMLKLAPIKVH
jgi:thiol-disulfide isomerase/thioredoxin